MWVEYSIFATQNKLNTLSSSQIKPLEKIYNEYLKRHQR